MREIYERFKRRMRASVVMPRWLWYTLILAAVVFAVEQVRDEKRWQARVHQYEVNRADIDVNAERITLIENALLKTGVIEPEQVRKVRERLSQGAQSRVTHAGESDQR